MSKAKKQCVYQDGWQEWGRDAGVGDGMSAPSRLLVSLHETEQAAEEDLAAVVAASRAHTSALVPGGNSRLPMLRSAEYDPLDFVPRQNRDEYVGQRYAALCGTLADEAVARRARLVAGNA